MSQINLSFGDCIRSVIPELKEKLHLLFALGHPPERKGEGGVPDFQLSSHKREMQPINGISGVAPLPRFPLYWLGFWDTCGPKSTAPELKSPQF